MTALDMKRESFADSLGWPLSRLLTEMCCGVAALIGGADVGLLQVRGYIVLPAQKMFMEHWWCRKGDTVVDPLTRLTFGGCEVERLEVGAAPASAYDGIGTFDCLAMTGPCTRRALKQPDCEWCEARKRLTARRFTPYELRLRPGLQPL